MVGFRSTGKDCEPRMKQRSLMALVILALGSFPMLSSAAGPPDCRMDPLTDAEYLAVQESFWSVDGSSMEQHVAPTPTKSDPYGKPGTLAPIGVEVVEPAGCPEISGP